MTYMQRRKLECFIKNLIDIRLWFCECGYDPVYGKYIAGGCKYHD